MPTLLAPALLLVLAQASPAAPPVPLPAASAPVPCTGEAYRQFDFWIGEWDVVNQQPPAGRTPPVSKSRISRILNGCALLEEYETVAGYAGKSLNFYDSNDRRWHETWIDSGGTPLYLSGALHRRAMVMADERKSTVNGKNWIQRITWTPVEGGKVRQHWEKSSDGGQSWENVFDGLYTRRAPTAR